MVRRLLTRRTLVLTFALATALPVAFLAFSPQAASPMMKNLARDNAPGEWRFWGADAWGTRYSPLDQINANNFNSLQIAWQYKVPAEFGVDEYYRSTPLMANGRLISVGLPDLRGALGLGVDEASWIPTAYNMAMMFIGPFSVFLGGLLGVRQWGQTPWIVETRIADLRSDRDRRHRLGGVRSQQGNELVGRLHRGVEPVGVIARFENDRHALVSWTHQFVGVGGENGARFEGLTVRLFPGLPQARKGDRSAGLRTDEEGPLALAVLGPFVEPVGRHQAAPPFHGVPKRRLVVDGFAARHGVIYDTFEGILSAPPRVRPRPFEIILETPQSPPAYLKEAAFVAALQSILAEYQKFIAYAPNL